MATRRKKAGAGRKPSRACTCSWLKREADEPVSPITFDQEMGEYHLRHADGGISILRYCPWCGGAAPTSERASLFAVVPSAEWRRLALLTSKIRSVAEAVRVLGKPDERSEGNLVITTPPDGRAPQEVRAHATLTFKRLSKVADVALNDFGPNSIAFTFSAKPIGARGSRRQRGATPVSRRTRDQVR